PDEEHGVEPVSLPDDLGGRIHWPGADGRCARGDVGSGERPCASIHHFHQEVALLRRHGCRIALAEHYWGGEHARGHSAKGELENGSAGNDGKAPRTLAIGHVFPRGIDAEERVLCPMTHPGPARRHATRTDISMRTASGAESRCPCSRCCQMSWNRNSHPVPESLPCW